MSARVFDAAGREKAAALAPADEFEYWTAQAAMLDPAAMVYISGAAFAFTVPAAKTYYLLNAWNARLGSTGPTFFQRDPRLPMPMAAGFNMQGNGTAGAFAYYCDPSLVSGGAKYADPKGLYFERLARLKHLQLHVFGVTMAAGQAQGTTASFTFPTDFTNALLAAANCFDMAWVALGAAGGNIINLNDEVSDDHQQRVASSLMVPFARATFGGIVSRGSNVAGSATTTIAGNSSVALYKLPSDW